MLDYLPAVYGTKVEWHLIDIRNAFYRISEVL
jgi:hypothetical protein